MDIAISTPDPLIVHVHERGLFAFSIYDPMEGDSLRGLFGGPIPGAVRPLLPWKIESLDALADLRREGKR